MKDEKQKRISELSSLVKVNRANLDVERLVDARLGSPKVQGPRLPRKSEQANAHT